jgi:hypothetical protein
MTVGRIVKKAMKKKSIILSGGVVGVSPSIKVPQEWGI